VLLEGDASFFITYKIAHARYFQLCHIRRKVSIWIGGWGYESPTIVSSDCRPADPPTVIVHDPS
jgi:hypothetical protein